jgi:hypothetical protein
VPFKGWRDRRRAYNMHIALKIKIGTVKLVKVKVIFTLEKAMKAQSRGIALLFL